ncbi:MAG: hypothetical protein IKY65_04475 [Rikenellaceae bacterium]|nr:hypothetical protein [Rikenellaceae bacterium]
MLSSAFVAWMAYIFPPLACSCKKAALITKCVLAGVVSFCLSAGMTRAWLDLFPLF